MCACDCVWCVCPCLYVSDYSGVWQCSVWLLVVSGFVCRSCRWCLGVDVCEFVILFLSVFLCVCLSRSLIVYLSVDGWVWVWLWVFFLCVGQWFNISWMPEDYNHSCLTVVVMSKAEKARSESDKYKHLWSYQLKLFSSIKCVLQVLLKIHSFSGSFVYFTYNPAYIIRHTFLEQSLLIKKLSSYLVFLLGVGSLIFLYV